MKERFQELIGKRLRNRRNELRSTLPDDGGRRVSAARTGEPLGQVELREVENALQRLENRTYGICRQCGELITHGRLYNVPHTDRCGHCAAAV